MSKKPAAALSANLVAVKGTAVPAPDMPGRLASAPVSVSGIDGAVPATIAADPPLVSTVQGESGGQPLNFRVPERRIGRKHESTFSIEVLAIDLRRVVIESSLNPSRLPVGDGPWERARS